jgi:hypothetical protein
MSGFVGTAPGTTTIQLPSGQIIQITDWIDDKHYGSVEWETSDTAPLQVFSTGKSQAIVGGQRPQLRTDTNVPRNGDSGLPKDWEFLVYSIAIEFARATRTSGSNSNPLATDTSDPVSLDTAFELNRRLFCEYKYNGKTYAEGLLGDFPAGSGLDWQGSQTARETVTNGPRSPRDRIAMILPLHERENLGYSLNMTPEIQLTIAQDDPAGGSDFTHVDMRIKKVGLIKRNV